MTTATPEDDETADFSPEFLQRMDMDEDGIEWDDEDEEV